MCLKSVSLLIVSKLSSKITIKNACFLIVAHGFAESQVEELSTAAQGYHKVVKENRTLYNMVQDLKGKSCSVTLSTLWHCCLLPHNTTYFRKYSSLLQDQTCV